MNPGGGKEPTGEEFCEEVWSVPTVQAAAELEIAEAALAKRDFPRLPTKPKIPPPVIQPSGHGTRQLPEQKQQYPFWLKYQGR
jgi:hypothetical protein